MILLAVSIIKVLMIADSYISGTEKTIDQKFLGLAALNKRF